MRLGDLKKKLTKKTTTQASDTPAQSGDDEYLVEVFVEERRIRSRIMKASSQADADEKALMLCDDSHGDWARAQKRERISE